ncbi:IS256 family transposase [Aeoliella sp. ICT_H6.2]|uniref:Mutator family transposase n=1 Tax=Aeoliella straminimaris TaxID=2954799 RepID=A0A9X2F699_9BACT|nr:IS256 family transposase [Aeoliella straminimaris]MCO6042534.1 IS256 family transposase [Aeoliella straminimaris]
MSDTRHRQEPEGAVVRRSVEETLNGLLEAEADELCGAKRYERSPDRLDTRAGSYDRGLQTKAGPVKLKVPRLRSLPFETQIIERYRRRESSVEEALMEMYLAGVSVRRVEDITEALWGTRVSPSTVSELNQQLYERIEAWRNQPIEGQFAYVALDGIWLKRSWGGEVKNVAVLVAIGVDEDGYRQVLGVCEGAKEDTESWRKFLRHLKERGLKGVRLVTSDKCLGLVEALAEFYPEADWQRCVVHWYRNVGSEVPRHRMKEVMAMLKAIHAQEDREAAEKKAIDVVEKLRALKLQKAAKTVEEGVSETLRYMAYPREHWTRIRTNNALERLMREIRRRTRVVGAFPDGNSALMLVAARLRHVAGTKWGTRKYLDMERLQETSGGAS